MVGVPRLAGRVLAGALALLLISAIFGDRAWAITGGEPDDGRHPNVGVMIIYDPAIGSVHTFESGTLIHPRVFLTAGHGQAFIESLGFTLLGVTFDQEPNLEDETTWLQISDLTYSYDFSGASLNSSETSASPNSSDIGLLILKEPVRGIVPATLPAAGFLDDLKQARQLKAGPHGTELTVVGFGMLLDWPPPETFWEDPVRRNLAQSGYLGLNDGWLLLNHNLAAGHGGVANGDSGGPTFWTDPKTGEEVLVSITSWATPERVGIGVSYRIDTVESLQFIQDVIDSLGE